MSSTSRGIAVVTGANGGMGKEICKALLKADYRVVMVCRPDTLPSEFFLKMRDDYGPQKVRLLTMDLMSVTSIRDAAKQLIYGGESIDILVNNAGIMGWKPTVTEEGYEGHNMVNCMGPMLFTYLLRPLLHKGSRVVNTVSVTIWIGRLRVRFPYPQKHFNRIQFYSDSKLAFQLLSSRLAKEWKKSGITINTVDPGIVDTPIIQLHNWVDPLTDIFFRPLIRTPQEGASTAIFLALDPSVSGKTGGLYKDCKPRRLRRLANHPASDRTWSVWQSLFMIPSTLE